MADLNGDGKESFGEKLQGIGQQIGEKFEEVRDTEGVQNAIQGAADAAKKVTGGKFDEQIDSVADKLSGDDTPAA
ncbi:antitoxin [Gulosibacter macacae]|uniref:Antitoxin n=1 Tax=Gulosibacter macacae TaxID=2488791 RepID=A0A3P3VYP6_9MICO|nr:Rv0909 family putative TA system antitoxin [Gulosibacter macacae]RRJ86726.1 antitoxin [Gulosibacter macacae]